MEIVIAIMAGAFFGVSGMFAYDRMQRINGKNKSEQTIAEAKNKASDIILKAKDKALSVVDEAKKEESEIRREIKKTEQRLAERENNIDRKLDDLDRRSEKLRSEEDDIDKLKSEIHDIRLRQQEKLEKIAKLKKSEAAEKLMKMTERDIKEDLTGLTALKLTDDDMKGRIIGKEGRNIQAIQRETGVDVLVDDTPGMVVLSSFDPVRRQVARLTLEMLMKDGRIHPGRIEEVVAKAKKQIDKEVKQAGEDAMREAGIVGIPKEMLRLLGELKFRTSYGQNVLKHSTEMAQIAGMIAEEIGANVRTVKIATLLHDVGKAVTHKVEGKHHHIGAELARKYGLSEEIAHAIEAHHDDIEATTPEALIVRVVDAASAARPGARNVSAENFTERMRDLENVATSFKGIDKAYAISAGREIRVIVSPETVDDLSAIKIARDIANKIESTMQYPGTIKVNVIRETRAIEFAK